MHAPILSTVAFKGPGLDSNPGGVTKQKLNFFESQIYGLYNGSNNNLLHTKK